MKMLKSLFTGLKAWAEQWARWQMTTCAGSRLAWHPMGRELRTFAGESEEWQVFFSKLFLLVPISIVLPREKKSSLLASLLSTFLISSSCRESKLRSCGTCLGFFFITAFFYQHFPREVWFWLLCLTHHTSCVQSMRNTVLKALFERYGNTRVRREDGPLRWVSCVCNHQEDSHWWWYKRETWSNGSSVFPTEHSLRTRTQVRHECTQVHDEERSWKLAKSISVPFGADKPLISHSEKRYETEVTVFSRRKPCACMRSLSRNGLLGIDGFSIAIFIQNFLRHIE